MLTPPDLDREIGLTGLYLCGRGAHPEGAAKWSNGSIRPQCSAASSRFQ
ncbi:hypothetical protein SCA6_012518 [Theobroma cacao]